MAEAGTRDPSRIGKRAARSAGLRYVSDAMPGIRRRRSGKGFVYLHANGRAVRDAKTLARIRALAVPPAYADVWICADPRGHLQATGRDARGRKQYRYHPQWSEVRGFGKFDRLVAFGKALPKLRRAVRRDLKLPGFPREKVLAIAVALMAQTLLRVGNDAYARANGSFGLTTLRNRHVEFLRGGRARLSFPGKSGQAQESVLDDARLVKLMRACQQLPGQALFQYVDEVGKRQRIDSGMVNDYLRAAMGEDFTAKDFRTWGGTLLAFQLFAAKRLPTSPRGGAPSERALATAQNEVIAEVARTLGNTAAVCRKAYIDPALYGGWRDGALARASATAKGARQWEAAILGFLRRAHRRSGNGSA